MLGISYLRTNVEIVLVFAEEAVGSTKDVDYVYGALHRSWHRRENTRLQDLRDCKVVKVRLCKTADTQQHEFVLVTIHHPQNANCPRVLRFERRSERTDPTQDDSERNVDIIRDKVGYYGTVKDALKPRYQSPRAKKAYVCWNLTFKEGQNPNALDLFSAAIVLHRAGQNDTSITPMNYWFAHNLFRLLAYGREHTVDTTHLAWAPTPGHFFGLSVIDSFGKIKERPQDVSLEELAAREAEKRTLFKTLASSFTPNEDATTAEFSISPMPQGSFILSDDIVEYYKLLLAAAAEAERLIDRHSQRARSWTVLFRLDTVLVLKMMKARLERIEVSRRTEAVSERIAELEQSIRRLETGMVADPEVW